MSGILHALQTTSNTLDAFSKAIETEGLNIANASSPGWAALRVSVRPTGISGPGTNISGAGTNNDVVDITSSSDARAEAEVRSATAEATFSPPSSAEASPLN